jgi:hypothetical protein
MDPHEGGEELRGLRAMDVQLDREVSRLLEDVGLLAEAGGSGLAEGKEEDAAQDAKDHPSILRPPRGEDS